MTATPIYPIETMRGSLTSNYYCRMFNGHLIIQRKPNRKGHIPTSREAANQQHFAALYRVPKHPKTYGRPHGDHSILPPS